VVEPGFSELTVANGVGAIDPDREGGATGRALATRQDLSPGTPIRMNQPRQNPGRGLYVQVERAYCSRDSRFARRHRNHARSRIKIERTKEILLSPR
jgi:hypothetical protein